MTFLRELLAVILGVFISSLIMFFVFLALVSALSSSFMEEEKVVVSSNSVLVLDFDKQIKDYAPKSGDPFEELFGFEDEVIGLNEILNAIENAKYDDKVIGISLESIYLPAGIAQVQELRNKLYEFKESGKFVAAYTEAYDQKNYFLSSIADSLYVNPAGMMDFRGLSSEVLYFKNFQDKYGVKMEVIRHGKYKSAVEPFLESEMSPANREQIGSFLGSIWTEMLDGIGQERGLEVSQLNSIADDLLARTPELATENGLINSGLYEDQYRDRLKEMGELSDEDKLDKVSIEDYIKSGKGRIRSSAKDKIAVIYAQGELRYGEGNENYIGQGLINKALKKAREDESVKAVVLRVNSPGGNALVADLIWRELELTKKKKPLVVSMGSMATSGGYWISCNANHIVAQPTTITGSIGVFGIVPNIAEFSDRIGINAEQVGTNKNSVNYSLFEPMSDSFSKVTTESVEQVYKEFLTKVAEGRDMSVAAVDSIAQGRVWTGKQALSNGLVDQLGGLDDAVEVAAEMADLTEYKVKNYPTYEKEFKDLFKGPFAQVKEDLLIEEFGIENIQIYQQLKQVNQWKGMQARLPFLLEIN